MQPTTLLDAWATQLGEIPRPLLRPYFVPSNKPEGLVTRLDEVCEAHSVEYAVSFEAAAQRYAAFLSAVPQLRCRMLAGPGTAAAIAALGAREVSEGANLAIIEVKSAGDKIFRERVGGIRFASPIQVELDLMQTEGRTKEMAAHLRKERIGF